MDGFEKIGYSILCTIAIMISIFLYGLVGLLLIFGVGVLFMKVIKEHLQNKEDDYYSEKVDK